MNLDQGFDLPENPADAWQAFYMYPSNDLLTDDNGDSVWTFEGTVPLEFDVAVAVLYAALVQLNVHPVALARCDGKKVMGQEEILEQMGIEVDGWTDNR